MEDGVLGGDFFELGEGGILVDRDVRAGAGNEEYNGKQDWIFGCDALAVRVVNRCGFGALPAGSAYKAFCPTIAR